MGPEMIRRLREELNQVGRQTTLATFWSSDYFCLLKGQTRWKQSVQHCDKNWHTLIAEINEGCEGVAKKHECYVGNIKAGLWIKEVEALALMRAHACTWRFTYSDFFEYVTKSDGHYKDQPQHHELGEHRIVAEFKGIPQRNEASSP